MVFGGKKEVLVDFGGILVDFGGTKKTFSIDEFFLVLVQ